MSLTWCITKYNRIRGGVLLYKNLTACGCNALKSVSSSCCYQSKSFSTTAVVAKKKRPKPVHGRKKKQPKTESISVDDIPPELHEISEFVAKREEEGGKPVIPWVYYKQSIPIKYENPAEVGSKKVLHQPIPEKYDSDYVEGGWYPWWQKHYFTPKSDATSQNRDVFMMCLPPPNVTGVLHLGHALTCSIQDAIVRWHRMHGRETLWNPGSDHAGIATQVVVEKHLMRELNNTRHDLGRENFIEHVWSWKEKKGNQIYEQMKTLGASLDWSRECFTMDPKLARAVNEAFVRLYDEGLIYRSQRMVNWCPALSSAISDVEVENRSLEGRSFLELPNYKKIVEFGVIHTVAYPVDGSEEMLHVATTRLETMPGDVAICVHPDDTRYTHLHGKFVNHPLTEAKIPILCDEFVDRDFGTGAVKITPAHDQTDMEVGRRHDLASITVIDDEGNMTNVPEKYLGMHRFDAKLKIMAELKEKDLYLGWKEHHMVLPVCSRTGDVLEPKLTEQWYVDCTEMAQQAIQVERDKELEIIPQSFINHWHHWLENIQDWCISRQMWWGHRIPAYRVTQPEPEQEMWIIGRTEEEAYERASQKLNLPSSEITLKQDEDVLDTWFSSSLFPFSIFGWPDQTEDLQRYYPNTMLETAHDILFFWVARMVMMGLKLTGQLPFKQVLLHGILRDTQGRKMSKSLGNVIDPMDVIKGTTMEHLTEQLVGDPAMRDDDLHGARKYVQKQYPKGFPPCGTDALRFTLCSYNFKLHYINMNIEHVIQKRKFCNKMWQSFRFFLDKAGEEYVPNAGIELTATENKLDRWILCRLSSMLKTCDTAFPTFDLHHAAEAIEQFWIHEFCDVYLECSKLVFEGEDEHAKEVTKAVMHRCFDVTLRALSPFMPYITEELYQRLPSPDKTESICIAPYPHSEQYDYGTANEEEASLSLVQRIAEKSLKYRTVFGLTKQKADVYIIVEDEAELKTLEGYADAIKVLARSNLVHLLAELPEFDEDDIFFKTSVQPGIDFHMKLPELDYKEVYSSVKKKRTAAYHKMNSAAREAMRAGVSPPKCPKVKNLRAEIDMISLAQECAFKLWQQQKELQETVFTIGEQQDEQNM